MKLLFLFLASFAAYAQIPSATNSFGFCHSRKEISAVKKMTQSMNHLMSFKNQGGISNGGVCWWHSRFQRNALYLTYYTPAAPKPTLQEARQIIRDIRNYKRVVEIKGFTNFYEFSREYQEEIQAELETWQLYEGKRFTWIRGLRGSSKVNSAWMQDLMRDLYLEVEVNKRIAYQKLQMKGIVAHAWLVISMKQDKKGYNLEVLDSNFPFYTMFYRYNFGDTNLIYQNGEEFVPYLEHTNEVESIEQKIKEFCSKQS